MRYTTKKLVLSAAVGLLCVSGGASSGTISGSDHDLSGKTYTGGQICVACHTPHGGDTSVTDAPLWNHTVTTQTYTLYSSPTLDATVNQPAGVSKLCLSCHDGTVAIDSFGEFPTATDFLTGSKAVAGDAEQLTNDHPISFTYDTTLATTDGALHDPASKSVTIGSGGKTKTGTVADLMLPDGKVQCSSCHDVHNTYTAAAPLLKVQKNGSQICLTCHDK